MSAEILLLAAALAARPARLDKILLLTYVYAHRLVMGQNHLISTHIPTKIEIFAAYKCHIINYFSFSMIVNFVEQIAVDKAIIRPPSI